MSNLIFLIFFYFSSKIHFVYFSKLSFERDEKKIIGCANFR